jgi:hypothetical protein
MSLIASSNYFDNSSYHITLNYKKMIGTKHKWCTMSTLWTLVYTNQINLFLQDPLVDADARNYQFNLCPVCFLHICWKTNTHEGISLSCIMQCLHEVRTQIPCYAVTQVYIVVIQKSRGSHKYTPSSSWSLTDPCHIVYNQSTYSSHRCFCRGQPRRAASHWRAILVGS